MISKKELAKLITLFLSWRISLFVVGFCAQFIFSYQPSFPYYQILNLSNLPQWIYSWANFDGVHYLTIVKNGYVGTGLIQAFFPLFPLMIKSFSIAFDPILAGLIVSNFLALLFIVLFYLLLKKLLPRNKVWLTLIVTLLFPTSFFLGAYYTESLFLVTVVGAFLAAQHKKWWLAGILAALASATRIVGVVLIGALVWEWLSQNKYLLSKLLQKFSQKEIIKLKIQNLLWILMGGLGLGSYMLYLYRTFGDPLYFFHVQSEFGGGRQESLVMYPQVVWRYFKILLTARPFDLKYLSYIQEFIAGTLGLLLILLGLKKWKTNSKQKIKTNIIPTSYVLFSLGVFLIPTLTGTLSSMPRYILVAFPIFIVIAQLLQNKYLRWIYLLGSAFLLGLNTVLFIQGYWVA